MKAEIKRLHSPDIDNLSIYSPENSNNFGFLLQVLVGIKGIESEESFDMIVCTPKWLEANFNKSDVLFGEHYLIVFQFSFERIRNKINDYIDGLTEEDWGQLASKIDRIGKWEFRDYQELS